MIQKISIELFNSIASENLSSIVRAFAEVALDNTIVKEGVGRQIPVFNILHSLYQAGVAIKEQLFIQKIIKFWEPVSNVPYEERLKFVEEMDQNPEKKRVWGETLLLLIDRADSLEKPLILGRLWQHQILEHISYEDAMRLSYIVDRVYMPDLNYLTRFSSGIQSNPNIAASLQSAGLLKLALSTDYGYLGEPSPAGIIYELNDYGKMLLQYGLDSAV
jgi:hypothetical protein